MEHDSAEEGAANEAQASVIFARSAQNQTQASKDDLRRSTGSDFGDDIELMSVRSEVQQDLTDEASLADMDSPDSDEWDDEWILHVNSLPIWASPLSRMAVMIFFVSISITVAGPSMEVIYYKLACQELIKKKLASPVNPQCDPVQTQDIVATYSMWDMIISWMISLATCTKVSSLSDTYGRKPFLTAFIVLFAFSMYLRYFLICTTDGFPMVPMWILSAIVACSGGPVVLMALNKAYIVDISRPLDRVSNMSIVGVAFLAGQIVGPMLSSFVLSNYDKHASSGATDLQQTNLVPPRELGPVRVALVVLTMALAICIFLLPELRSHKLRMKSRNTSMVLLRANRTVLPSTRSKLWQFVKDYFSPLRMLIFPPELKTFDNIEHYLRIRICVFFLSIVEILLGVIMLTFALIELQYCIYKFKWDSVTISNYNIAKSTVGIAVIGACLPVLYKIVFPRIKVLTPRLDILDYADTVVLVVGSLFMFISHLGIAFAPNGTVFFVFSIINILGTIYGPISASAPIKFFPLSKVGEYYGAAALAQGILSLCMPIINTFLYKWGIRNGFPGLPFILTGMLAVVTLVSSVVAKWAIKDRQSLFLN